MRRIGVVLGFALFILSSAKAQYFENNGSDVVLASSTALVLNDVNYNNAGDVHANSGSNTYIIGSNDITLGGTSTFNFSNVTLNTSGLVTLNTNADVTDQFSFSSGKISVNSSKYILFTSSSSHTGVSSSSYISGIVKKTGSTDFTFPVGNTSYYRPIGISSLSLSDTFTADYNQSDPDASYSRSSYGTNINHVGAAEFWNLSKTGSANGKVTLYWNSLTSGGVDNINDLLVLHWNGAQWDSVGNSNITGDVNAGSVTSNTLSSFSPFTLGSSSSDNPLPIELLSFFGFPEKQNVVLNWSTASEINNDYYTLERSNDGYSFSEIANINSKGNSNKLSTYSFKDKEPFEENYYRLKNNDIDGEYDYSPIIYIKCNACIIENSYSVYFSSGYLNVSFNTINENDFCVEVVNTNGVIIKKICDNLNKGENTLNVSVEHLPKGVYVINLYEHSGLVFTRKVIIH